MGSFWTDNQVIDNLEDKFGNRFMAVINIADSARKEVNNSYGFLSGSQALAKVCVGYVPDKMKHNTKDPSSYLDRFLYEIDDYLTQVSDESVKQAVRDSLTLSFKYHYLIYDYKEITQLERQSRVRILCNILWDKLLNQD